jgi:hypothetical protein
MAPKKQRKLRELWWSFFYQRCLIGFPWFWPARPHGVPAMLTARWLVRRHFALDHPAGYRVLARVLATIAWPVAVMIHLWEIRHYRGSDAVPLRRVPGAFWAAMRHNVLPGEYFAYRLWKPERKMNIDNYLYAKEGPRLFALLNQESDPNPINDKLAFYDMCVANGLPSPEVLAVFTPAGRLREFESKLPPRRHLFVKLRKSWGSAGAERFRWRETDFESSRGFHLKAEELPGYLEARARTEHETVLVQPNLVNHVDLQLNADAGLALARVITGIAADGNVSVIVAFIYFTDGDNLPADDDNLPARDLRVALIDVTSGRLMSAPQSFSDGIRGNHQSDDRKYASYELPDWNSVLRHLKVAHQACRSFAFVGWDVAFTNQGIMILEGNANWCADEFQRLQGTPLGNTTFSDVLQDRLASSRLIAPKFPDAID